MQKIDGVTLVTEEQTAETTEATETTETTEATEAGAVEVTENQDQIDQANELQTGEGESTEVQSTNEGENPGEQSGEEVKPTEENDSEKTEENAGAAENGETDPAGESSNKGEEKPPKETLETIAKKSKSVIAGIVQYGKKGVSNKQMLVAMQANIMDREILKMLFDDFKDVFLASAKYAPDHEKAMFEEFVRSQEGYDSYRVTPTGKKVREQLDKGVPAITIYNEIMDAKTGKKKEKTKETENSGEETKTENSGESTETTEATETTETTETEGSENSDDTTQVAAESGEKQNQVDEISPELTGKNKLALADIVRANPEWRNVIKDGDDVEIIQRVLQNVPYSKIADEFGFKQADLEKHLFKNDDSLLNVLKGTVK